VVDLNFTWQDVEAECGDKKPWTRRDDFLDEIKPDDMAETAVTYARAAPEAEGAGDLARAASELGEDSGAVDERSLVDGEGRVRETKLGLQDDGGKIYDVVDRLVRAMNRAVDATNEVDEVITAPHSGMDAKLRLHNEDAVQEWNSWQAALEAAVQAANASRVPGFDPAIPPPAKDVTVSIPGREAITIAPGGTLLAPVYALPDSLAASVRKRHLEAAATDAEAAYDDIQDAVAQYRHDLVQYGQELDGMGYDLADGPLALWTTREQGTYLAEQLNKALEADDPDMTLVEMYTQGLSAIADGVYGDALNPEGEPLRNMTFEERVFLQRFFDTLSRDSLVALGEVAGFSTAKVDIANGINMLFDDRIGGMDPLSREGEYNTPESIKYFVYDYRDSDIYQNSKWKDWVAEVERFNAFGDIMGHATVGSGDTFSRSLAQVAVDIEKEMNNQAGFVPPENYLKNLGSSGLLHAVSLNTEISAEMLNRDDWRTDLLKQGWDDSRGVAELIHAGTSLPEGVGHNDPEAAQYVEAAYNVLRTASENPRYILGEGPTSGVTGADHTLLERAVGDVMLDYMDMVSKGAEESGFFAPEDPNAENPYTDRDLHGTDYLYSFSLDANTREELFKMMNHADEDVRQDFFGNVGTWQSVTAYNAFQRDGGDHHTEAATFEDIGRVAGLVVKTQDVDPVEDSSKYQFTTYGAIGTAASVINTLGDFGKGNIVGQAVSFGLTEGLRYSLPNGAEAVKQAQWDAENYGDTAVRANVANAAIRADYQGLADGDFDRMPKVTDPNVEHDDIRRATLNTEGVYDHYRDALVEAYNDAVHGDATAN
jgi:hypothetical protein